MKVISFIYTKLKPTDSFRYKVFTTGNDANLHGVCIFFELANCFFLEELLQRDMKVVRVQ